MPSDTYSRALYLCRPSVIVGLLTHFSYNFPVKRIIWSFLLFFLASFVSIVYHPRTHLSSPGREWIYPLVQSALLSPLTLGLLVVENDTFRVAKSIINAMTTVYPSIQSEMIVYPSVATYLKQGVMEGRIHRNSLYDLYLPNHKVLLKRSNQSEIPCMIFLPGMLVDHASYANVGQLLSDNGIVVVVVSAEPLRMPAKYLGAGPNDITKIMNKVKNKLDQIVMGEKTSTRMGTINWIIGGHSMGAYAAMNVIKHIGINKLVIWGAGNIDERVPYLRKTRNGNLRVLCIQATNDSIAAFNHQASTKFKFKMPEDTRYIHIHGGNHAGFACYPPNKFDNSNIISWRRQQKIACVETSKFIYDKR